MKNSSFTGKKSILFGIIAILLGIFLFLFQFTATRTIIDYLCGYFFFIGLFNLVARFFRKKKSTESLVSNLIKIVLAFLIGLFNEVSPVPVFIIVICLGIYQLFTAGINYITYFIYRANNVPNRFRYLLDALIYTLFGVSAILSPHEDADLQFIFIGIYLFFLGYTYLRDGLFFDKESERNTLKRRFRLNLPIVIVALLPHKMLTKINQTITKEDDDTVHTYVEKKDDTVVPDLEVFIHVTESGFGSMGHVDICYNGTVISYGSYDTQSEKLGGAIGDGVLFKAPRDKYIEFCKIESKKTLFGYGLQLNDEQKKAVENRINAIQEDLVEWNPPAIADMYSYKLKNYTGAELFKFTHGKFKTYFVLSTNCVLLADSIIGQAGTDILSMKGFITPGTYQDYLDKEYQKPNSFVVTKAVYN